MIYESVHFSISKYFISYNRGTVCTETSLSATAIKVNILTSIQKTIHDASVMSK